MSGPSFQSSLATPLSSGLQLIDGGDIIAIVKSSISGQGGLTGGASAAAATPLNVYINEASSVGTTTNQFQLPPALQGIEVTFINSGASAATILPCASNPQNAGAADVIVPLASSTGTSSVSVAANAVEVFSCATLGRWKCQF